MRTIYAHPDNPNIRVGYQGEHLVTDIIFDVSHLEKEFGPGDVHLMVQRKHDVEPYLATVETVGSQVHWIMTASDTASPGYGTIQLMYLINGRVAKDEVYHYFVEAALGNKTAPDPALPYLAQVAANATRADNAADQASVYAQTAKEAQAKAEMAQKKAEEAAAGSGGGAVVDTTLTKKGQAAEAWKTGDEIRKLRNEKSSNVRADGYDIGDKIKAKEFANLFAGTEDICTFLFFTDPHFSGALHDVQTGEQLAAIRSVYETTPTSFCLCGGDWLINNNNTASALYKLGSFDAYMRKNFPPFLPVLGNHDTNYQNDKYIASGPSFDRAVGIANMLTRSEIDNIMFREEGRSYYSFKAPGSMVYVLDTGIDWVGDMDAFRWAQIDWLSKSLILDDAKHSFVAMHIAFNGGSSHGSIITPLCAEAVKVINAYNGRAKSAVFNGETYDFSGATGTIHFIIAGHMHEDYNRVVDGVPVIMTTNVADDSRPGGEKPAFDLCLADYGKAMLHLVRVGSGQNRNIAIIPTIENTIEKGLPVTDGLVFHLDGADRGGVSGQWKDLVSGENFILTGCTENQKSVGFKGAAGSYGANESGVLKGFPSKNHTIQVVFKSNRNADAEECVFFNPVQNPAGREGRRMAGVYRGGYVKACGGDEFAENKMLTQYKAGEFVTVSLSERDNIENHVKLDASGSETYSVSTKFLCIGCLGRAAYYFGGEIYAIRIYNRLLSEEEILKNQDYDHKRYT